MRSISTPVAAWVVPIADMLAQAWLWIADSFEDRPLVAMLLALAFAALIATAVVTVP